MQPAARVERIGLMVLNVSTRKYHRAVRLPESDLAKARGDGTSKSAVSRRFVALSRKKMRRGLARLGSLGTRPASHPDRRSACRRPCPDGGDRRRWQREKHVLAVVEGATENTVVVQALIDAISRQGARSDACRGFVHRRLARRHSAKRSETPSAMAAAIQRSRFHKGRNIIERLPQHLHASVKKALRQAWDQDDANEAERLWSGCATWQGVWT